MPWEKKAPHHGGLKGRENLGLGWTRTASRSLAALQAATRGGCSAPESASCRNRRPFLAPDPRRPASRGRRLASRGGYAAPESAPRRNRRAPPASDPRRLAFRRWRPASGGG